MKGEVRFVLRFVVAQCAATMAVVPCSRAWTRLFPGGQWAAGKIMMQLELQSTKPASPLIDGSTSWNDVAIAALKEWNAHLTISQFDWVSDSTAPVDVSRYPGNGYNNVFWSDTVYGESWGAQGADAVAITINQTSEGQTTESDVLFNSSSQWTWDSYRGALRKTSGGKPIIDFERVAAHEFGHVLGLGHPDQAGQTVAAVMNSTMSDTDSLTADDIAGGAALYGSVKAPTVLYGLQASYVFLTDEPLSWAIELYGTPPFTFTWSKDGVVKTSGSMYFEIESPVVSDSGTYAVKISNAAGEVTETSVVKVWPKPEAPSITAEPLDQVVSSGATAMFTLQAAGTARLIYQWQRLPKGRTAWEYLDEGGNFKGTLTPSLTITGCTSTMSGDQYRCLVVNGVNPSVTSMAARLKVSP